MDSYSGIKWSLQQRDTSSWVALENASIPCAFGDKYVLQAWRQHPQYTRWPGQQHRTQLQELQHHRSTRNAGEGRPPPVRESLQRRHELVEESDCFSSCTLPVERKGGFPSLILLFLLSWRTFAALCGEGFSSGAFASEAQNYGSPDIPTSPSERQPKGLLSTLLSANGEKSLEEFMSSSAAASIPLPAENHSLIPPPQVQYEYNSFGARVCALGDVHGDLYNTILILSAARLIDLRTLKWTGGNAILVQTGDVLDRGDKGAQLLQLFGRWALQARAVGGRVVRLVGNHEGLNVCGLFQYASSTETAAMGGIFKRWKRFSFGVGDLGKLVKTMSIAVKIDDTVYSHAGIAPAFAKLGLKELTRRFRVEFHNDCEIHKASLFELGGGASAESLLVTGPKGPLWTRDFSTGTPATCHLVDQTLKELNAKRMVVGHNVQRSMQIEVFCDGKLIAIDSGLSHWVQNSPSMLEIRSGSMAYAWNIEFPPSPEEGLSAFKKATEKAVVRPLFPPPKSPPSTPQEELPSTSSLWPSLSQQRAAVDPAAETASLRRALTSEYRYTLYSVRKHIGAVPRTARPARTKLNSPLPILQPSSLATATSAPEENKGEEFSARNSPLPVAPPSRPRPPRSPLPQSYERPESLGERQPEHNSSSEREEL